MNFQGDQAISRSTRASGRIVLLVSATLVLNQVGWLSVSESSALGITLEKEAFEPFLITLVAFLTVAHLVNWNGDRLSYAGWNVDGRKPGGARWSAPSKSRLADLLEDLEKLSADSEKESETRLSELKEKIPAVAERLESFQKQTDAFRRYSFFYVWIWHAGMPVAAAFVSFAVAYYA